MSCVQRIQTPNKKKKEKKGKKGKKNRARQNTNQINGKILSIDKKGGGGIKREREGRIPYVSVCLPAPTTLHETNPFKGF